MAGITGIRKISVVGASSVFWLLLAAAAGYTSQVKPPYKVKQTMPAGRQVKQLPQALKLGLITLLLLTTINAGLSLAMYAGDIYFAKGLEAKSKNQFELASANFDKAAALYPVNGKIMFEKGRMYQLLMLEAIGYKYKGSYEQYLQKSINAFNRAIEAEPLEADYKIFLAYTYGEIGQIDEAKTTLDFALSRYPYSVSGHRLYGKYELAQGNDAEALSHFEKAIDLAPTKAFPDVYSKMAQLYKKAGNTKKAKIYENAARLKKPVGYIFQSSK